MIIRAVFLPFFQSGGRALLGVSVVAGTLLVIIDATSAFGGQIVALCTSRSTSSASVDLPRLPFVGLLTWALMVIAMAPLLLRDEIVYLRERNFPRNRRNAILAFLLGYASPWLLLSPAHDLIQGHRNDNVLALGLIAGTVIWLCSPLRQRLLNACHRRPLLPVDGIGMMAHTSSYGVRTGAYCSAVCGPLMIITLLVENGHSLFMAVFGVPIVIERYLPSRSERWQLPIHPIGRFPRWAAASIFVQR